MEEERKGGSERQERWRTKRRRKLIVHDEFRSSWATKMSEVFGDGTAEELKSMASTEPGGWTEAWARKVMEMGEGEEEEVLKCLHRAMQIDFGHEGVETMVEGIRSFVRERRRARRSKGR